MTEKPLDKGLDPDDKQSIDDLKKALGAIAFAIERVGQLLNREGERVQSIAKSLEKVTYLF